MKTPFLLAALLAATASAQTVPRLEPADTSPITQAPETDPTHGAIIPAEGITLEERAEDGNDTEAMPSLFRHEFNLPGSADDEDRIHCGGDVHDKTIPDFAPYQGVRCTTRYPVSRELAYDPDGSGAAAAVTIARLGANHDLENTNIHII